MSYLVEFLGPPRPPDHLVLEDQLSKTYPAYALSIALNLLSVVAHVSAPDVEKTELVLDTILLVDRACRAEHAALCRIWMVRLMAAYLVSHVNVDRTAITADQYRQKLREASGYLEGTSTPPTKWLQIR